MERALTMTEIAGELTAMIQKYTSRHRTDISVVYSCPSEEDIQSRYTAWDRVRFGLMPREEYFEIWKTNENYLLYVVPVSGDSYLTAIWEAMELISRKFC